MFHVTHFVCRKEHLEKFNECCECYPKPDCWVTSSVDVEAISKKIRENLANEKRLKNPEEDEEAKATDKLRRID